MIPIFEGNHANHNGIGKTAWVLASDVTMKLSRLSEEVIRDFIWLIEIEDFAVMNHSLLRERKLPVVCTRARMERDFLECAAQMVGNLIPEFFGCLGKSVIVVAAPRLVHIVDASRGGSIGVFRLFALFHTLGEKADDRVVFRLIDFPRHFHALRLGKAAAVLDDCLQSHDSLIDDSLPLGIHLVEFTAIIRL